MRIKHLEVTNGLQHRSLEADFTDFNAIIGPNGCGKSSIAELIGFALTGDFTWPGTIETIVRQGEDSGKVVLIVEDEGEEIEIVTALGRTSRKLTRGDLKITKSSEVLEYIERVLLRTPSVLVNEASIVRQGRLDAGLFTTQARRQQIFQRLAGLNDVESKRKQLADAKAACTPFMLSFDLDAKRRQVDDLDSRSASLQDQAAELLSGVQLSVDDYNRYKGLLANIENLNKFNAEQAILTEERKRIAPIVVDARAALDDIEKRFSDLEASVEANKQGYEDALKSIARAEAAAKQVAERERLSAKLETAKAEMSTLDPIPASFDGDAEIDTLIKIGSDTSGVLGNSQRIVNELSKITGKTCPTCGQPIEDASAIIAEHNKTVQDMLAILNDTEALLGDCKKRRSTWERSLFAYREKCAQLKSVISSSEQSLSAMSEISSGDINVEDSRKRINEYSVLCTALSAVRSNRDDIKAAYNEAVSSLKVCEAKLDRVSQDLARLSGNDVQLDMLHTARKYVSDYESQQSQMSELDGQMSEVDRQLDLARKALADTEEKAAKAAKYAKFADYIEFARGALHRDNYPSGKIKSFIDAVLLSAEVYLDAMRAGFTISYDNENGFVAYFPEDGRTMRADRLSGGEKVTFSLAFRFAVNEIKSETGFLFLDEPTNHLDDEHIDNVVLVLDLVKKKLAGRVQLFIITHNEKVAAVADTVIQVDELKK